MVLGRSQNADVEVRLRLRDQASSGLKKFGAQLSSVQGVVGKLSAAMGPLGFGLAAGGLAAGFTGLIKSVADAGDEIQKMSIRTGFSTESLSELRFAAKLSGTTINGMETGFRRMADAVVDADRGLLTATQTFDELGISVQSIQGIGIEKQFEVISLAMAQVEDETRRVALANDLFGRSGTQLLPLLSQGAAGLEAMKQEARDLGIVFDKEAADKAAEFNDNLERLGSRAQGFAVSVGLPIISGLNKIAEAFINASEEAARLEKVQDISIQITTPGAEPAKLTMQELIDLEAELLRQEEEAAKARSRRAGTPQGAIDVTRFEAIKRTRILIQEEAIKLNEALFQLANPAPTGLEPIQPFSREPIIPQGIPESIQRILDPERFKISDIFDQIDAAETERKLRGVAQIIVDNNLDRSGRTVEGLVKLYDDWNASLEASSEDVAAHERAVSDLMDTYTNFNNVGQSAMKAQIAAIAETIRQREQSDLLNDAVEFFVDNGLALEHDSIEQLIADYKALNPHLDVHIGKLEEAAQAIRELADDTDDLGLSLGLVNKQLLGVGAFPNLPTGGKFGAPGIDLTTPPNFNTVFNPAFSADPHEQDPVTGRPIDNDIVVDLPDHVIIMDADGLNKQQASLRRLIDF